MPLAPLRSPTSACLLVTLLLLPDADGATREPADAALGQTFGETVRPFIATHCGKCHGAVEPKGQVNLTAYQNVADVVRDHAQWETILDVLAEGEMPPEEATPQPTTEARAAVTAWIRAFRAHEARRNAGDPGPVLARRLSNAEYDYTIRDLTGQDIRPAREFPIDPANEAGFDNSGESLAMSPALLKKYLAAASSVAEHLVLLPSGFAFGPHPVVSETDRDKYAVKRIMDFYGRQPTDLAAYFLAAWRHQHRGVVASSTTSLAARADEDGVSAKYLRTVWDALTRRETIGPLATLQKMWTALPAPTPESAELPAKPPAEVLAGCEKMRDFVTELREMLAPKVRNLELKAVAKGSQPFILWKNHQYATLRRSYDPAKLYASAAPDQSDERQRRMAVVTAINLQAAITAELAPGTEDVGAMVLGLRTLAERLEPLTVPNPHLAVPPDTAGRRQHEAAFARFASIFPDAFIVSERGRVHLDRPKEKADKGRLLSAGFHNMMGYFRDDRPLYELILDQAGQAELDRLWRDLDFVTLAPLRMHADFIFYERAEPPRTIKTPEFDFIRSEDKASASAPMLRRLAKVYLAKAQKSLAEDGGDAITLPVIRDYFKSVSRSIRKLERDRRAAEKSHLDGLVAFAEKAYRRPLTAEERTNLLVFYRTLRSRDGLDHEEAMRDSVASVLVSPHFFYRVDLVAEGPGPAALPDHALASRLSYFLWSSMPDQALLARARRNELHRPEVLAAEVRRMLRDPRARALAVEFGGNWLDFRRFPNHNSVDRERFPSFDNDLRQAMFEEPVRFFLDVAANDRSVLDFLDADHTFVNAPLAKHYGMPEVPADAGWQRVKGAGRYGRGGLLPMAVFLTQNAPGLRTSPVKRGYWVVRRALGEVIPPPPAQVPELPNDESKMGPLTLREALAKHREDEACATCHARFDGFGLAFEGYGPIGERRTHDLGGRPVDARASLPGGVEAEGFAGLRRYVRDKRQGDFLENLARKLLSYGLGRTLLLSDAPTIEAALAKLEKDGYRFGSLVESIVLSPQFLTKRGRPELAQKGK